QDVLDERRRQLADAKQVAAGHILLLQAFDMEAMPATEDDDGWHDRGPQYVHEGPPQCIDGELRHVDAVDQFAGAAKGGRRRTCTGTDAAAGATFRGDDGDLPAGPAIRMGFEGDRRVRAVLDAAPAAVAIAGIDDG